MLHSAPDGSPVPGSRLYTALRLNLMNVRTPTDIAGLIGDGMPSWIDYDDRDFNTQS